MLKDITFGQYYPGNSLLHRTDPRIKLVILVEYLVFVLIASTELAMAATLLFTAFIIAVSGVRFGILIKSVKPLIFVLIFTAVMNLFFTVGEGEPLVAWKFIKIYEIYKIGYQSIIFMLYLTNFIYNFYENFMVNRICGTIFYVRQPRTLRTSFTCDVLRISEPEGYPAPHKCV